MVRWHMPPIRECARPRCGLPVQDGHGLVISVRWWLKLLLTVLPLGVSDHANVFVQRFDTVRNGLLRFDSGASRAVIWILVQPPGDQPSPEKATMAGLE